jgi:hypothetical protein
MRLKSIIGYGILALITVLYFIPKTNLYYQLEHKLQPHGIIIHNEHVDDMWFWLRITDAQLFVQKIESLHVKNTRIMLFGGYNRINLEGITLAPTLGQFIPKDITVTTLHYALYNPFKVSGTALGDFGKAKITIDLYDGVVEVKLDASDLMKSDYSATLHNFTKDKKGAYHYEYRF